MVLLFSIVLEKQNGYFLLFSHEWYLRDTTRERQSTVHTRKMETHIPYFTVQTDTASALEVAQNLFAAHHLLGGTRHHFKGGNFSKSIGEYTLFIKILRSAHLVRGCRKYTYIVLEIHDFPKNIVFRLIDSAQ